MAQAKKPQQEDEPRGPMSPGQFGEQARALNEQIVQSLTKTGQNALQHYVDWLQGFADMQRMLAWSPQASQMDWFAWMMKAKADFNEQIDQDGRRLAAVGPAAPELVNPPAAAVGGAGCGYEVSNRA